MTQISGRRTGLTFTTALRPGGATFLKVFLFAAKHVHQVTDPLRRFQIIQFARWSVIEQLPGLPTGMPPRPLLLFQSNFDDDLGDYIDTFAMLLPWRFRAVWFTSSGYPGLVPPEGFWRWVQSLEATPGHYWSAYGGATTPMVDAALAVDAAITDLAARAVLDPTSADQATRTRSLTDEQFAAAFRQLLIEVQPWL